MLIFDTKEGGTRRRVDSIVEESDEKYKTFAPKKVDFYSQTLN
jgi:hypothetical protein